MYFLYTSDTCPKGVKAAQFLDKYQIKYRLINIDQQVVDQLGRAEMSKSKSEGNLTSTTDVGNQEQPNVVITSRPSVRLAEVLASHWQTSNPKLALPVLTYRSIEKSAPPEKVVFVGFNAQQWSRGLKISPGRSSE